VYSPSGSVPLPSHLISCTSTKSTNSLQSIIQISYPYSFAGGFLIQMISAVSWFYINCRSRRTTPCHLSADAYSIYSQLPYKAGGCSYIRNPTTRHAVVTGTHLSKCILHIPQVTGGLFTNRQISATTLKDEGPYK
jgi:hypothetical protein